MEGCCVVFECNLYETTFFLCRILVRPSVFDREFGIRKSHANSFFINNVNI